MSKCTTTTGAPQAAGFPVVSYRIRVVHAARMDALRHGVSPEPAERAALAEYRATKGNRHAAQRAGFAAVDLQCGRGGRRYGA
ncbi:MULTISPECIES: hypothetical protein [unclassified Xanthomonas]|uniref:hypothetical protein n=1 Tax=Xanthomonas sp. LMG 8992 TaxID=1591157 RepID=UPI00136E2CB3|nr:hypothetical protein [Xanthomonas sp. LMG 8992]